MKKIGKYIYVFMVVLAAGFLLSLILALPTLWLWNWLMPDIFGLKEIGFWQALGLNLLATVLLKQTSSTPSDK